MKEIRLNLNIILIYFLLFIVGVVTLLSPSDVLAQDGKDGPVLRYISRAYNNQLVPGESTTFFVEVSNDSDSPTTDIRFT